MYIPLYLIIGFNLFTLLVFITAPLDWSRGAFGIVIIYILINYFFIIVGYNMGIKKGRNKTFSKNPIYLQLSQKLISIIFSFYILTFLVKYAYLLRFKVIDIWGMFSYLAIGFVDPQLGYSLSLGDTRPFTVNWSVYTLISVIDQVFFLFGFLAWTNLKLRYRLLFIGFLLLEIFYWIGRGTGFGVVLLVSTLAICTFLNQKINKITRKYIILATFLFVISISVFSFLKTERAGGNKIDLQAFNQVSATVEEDHFMLKIIPEPLRQTYMFSTSYMCQGYYFLSLSFDTNFSWCYFFGNCPASLNFAKTFGFDLWKNTYMWKLYKKEGVDDTGKWHTAYLWFANDVSLFGVPFVLLLLSYFTAFAYSLIIKYDDFLSKILFVIFFNMLIYLFANNSYLSQYYYSVIVIFVLWYFSRVKKLKITGSNLTEASKSQI